MKIILTRHGRTIENDAGILQGHLPGVLNEKGIFQAQKLAMRLSGEIIHHVYSSDLARAADTTREILRYHPGIPVEYTEELREANLGDWQGKTKLELGLLNNPHADEMSPNGGESLAEMRLRAESFLARIRTKHLIETVLLVGHNGIDRTIVEVLTGKDSVESIGNTSVSIFEIDQAGHVDMRLFNCKAHLD